MNAPTLRTTYPCCGGRARIPTAAVPRERYDRQCPSCGQRWTIERRKLSERDGVRLDQLDWQVQR